MSLNIGCIEIILKPCPKSLIEHYSIPKCWKPLIHWNHPHFASASRRESKFWRSISVEEKTRAPLLCGVSISPPSAATVGEERGILFEERCLDPAAFGSAILTGHPARPAS